MSIPPNNVFNMQPVKEALPIRTEEGGSVKLNLSLTIGELTAISFIAPLFQQIFNKNIGSLVVATHAGMQAGFAEFQDKHFSSVPQAERSNLETLVHSVWEKTREYIEHSLQASGEEEAQRSFKNWCDEADKLAQGVRDKGGQCEVFNLPQIMFLNDLLASIRKPQN